MSNAVKPIAISINFDSLNSALGFPSGYRDPSFFHVFDRIAEDADERRFRFTIFVIGRDLNNPEIAARVRDWSEMGHEIANHSWSHDIAFGSRPADRIRDEVLRAHEAITACTGKEPRGFTAPAWNMSRQSVRALVDLGYRYDASLYPSVWLYPAQLKAAFNHLSLPRKMVGFLMRKDWLFPLTKPVRPFFCDRDLRPVAGDGDGRLVVLPMPTLSRMTVPCWHTVGFVLGWPYAKKLLNRCLDELDSFYYLIHPADILPISEIETADHPAIERLRTPTGTKETAFQEMFDILSASGRPCLTMGEMAERFAASAP